MDTYLYILICVLATSADMKIINIQEDENHIESHIEND